MSDLPTRSIKRFFKSAIVTAILVFGGLLINSVVTVHNEIWEHEKSPYYGKVEYFSAVYIGSWRNKLIKAKYDPDGIVLGFMEWAHEKAYENIISNIPEHDGERDTWYYRFAIAPAGQSYVHVKRKSDISTDELDKIAADLIRKEIETALTLSKKQMAGTFADRATRLIVFENATYFFRTYGDDVFSKAEFLSIEKKTYINSLSLIRNIDLDYFLNGHLNSLKRKPLLFAYETYLIGNNILRNSKHIDCHDKTITESMIYLHSELIPEWQQAYIDAGIEFGQEIHSAKQANHESIKHRLPTLYQYAYNQISPKVTKLLHDKCGIELKEISYQAP